MSGHRDDVAAIIERVAAEGLAGPRDLDVAIDAIFSTLSLGGEGLPFELEDGAVWKRITAIEAMIKPFDRNASRPLAQEFGLLKRDLISHTLNVVARARGIT